MPEFLHLDGAVSSDTYLGARMNQKTLSFHTQLHDWSEAQKLSSLVSRHAQFLHNPKTGEVYLPIKKLAEIEYWTKQVNRYYSPNKHYRPKSGSFMKIDVSKFNMKVEKNEERSKSAVYTRRPFSAVSRLTMGTHQRRFFGNDVHTVNNKLIDTQMHYSAQRREIYSATARKSAKSAKTESVKPELVEDGANDVINTDEKLEFDTATVSLTDQTNSSRADEPETQGQGHISAAVMQPQIMARSYSNRELNVISIDDCKLTCRYRPQVIKENHRIPDDLGAMQKARANKAKHENTKVKDTNVKVTDENNEEMNGHEADDEGETSDENTVQVNGTVKNNSIHETGNTSSNEGVNVDRNNNQFANTCQIAIQSNDRENKEDTKISAQAVKDTAEFKNDGEFQSHESTSSLSERSGRADDKHYHNHNGVSDQNYEQNGSQGTSKTSYGRITTLYTSSHSSKYMTKEEKEARKKKKPSRTSRINCAINDMVKERKVMNSLERDFDSRTAQYGRTVVGKTEGSETFKKIHANLRKKMEDFVNTHSAVKTKEFYTKSRTNSARSSVLET